MACRRLAIIGLDSAPASLVFGQFRDELPTLRSLGEGGLHGVLRSCHPPITIPAWMVMLTGKSAGQLGMYGFRSRKGRSYTEISLPTSSSVKEPTVWDILGARGKHVIAVAVPPTYPPRRVNGELVSCFMTPGTAGNFTYPASLKEEIKQAVGEYIIDVPFRREERDETLQQLHLMTERRFDLLKHLLTSRPWDFFISVEIGVDRLHHAFWKYFDPAHHLHEPGSKYASAVLDYYRMLDRRIGELLEVLGDDTAVMIVSDHGAMRMKGAFCINEWLAQEGYLALEEKPQEPTSLDRTKVDWARTRAWAWGGYYARVFLNVQSREEQGIIPPSEYEKIRSELKTKLCSIKGPAGESWETKVYRPEELYDRCNGDPSDLMVYFDDLYWRAAGTVGYPTNYLPENDTGPDDAVHSWEGIFILANAGSRGTVEGAELLDVAPTVLHLLGESVPEDMRGRVLL